jgi:serine/threonine protein phosphatase PrpC
MTLTLRYAARSHRGLIREGNQDSVYAGPRLLAVADGMGGMAAGDIASRLAITAMAPLDEDAPGDSLVDALRAAVDLANQNLRDAVDANPALEGMGTTLTSMLFSGTKFAMVHVGDSRCYLLRDGEFTQVTKDDTYVQMLVDEGRITEEEASVHPQRSLLIRALQGSDVDPQYTVRPAVAGDRYLLCSDGLSGPVSDESIATALRDYPDPDECADRLLNLALRGGGPDNITLIVADVSDKNIIEEAPIIGGAAAGHTGRGDTAESSAASRASDLTPRRKAPDLPSDLVDPSAVEEDDPRRHPGRTALLLALVLVVLGGGLWLGYRYTQSQYYVGKTDDDHIAIFRGVDAGPILGIKLNHLVSQSDLSMSDLSDGAQAAVTRTIGFKDLAGAENELAVLGEAPNLLPTCESLITPTPEAPTPSPSVTASPTPTRPGGSPRPTGHSPSPFPSPSLTPSPTPTDSPMPSSAPLPTPDCR